jgi:beta-lactamase superfamily II metal-dependent hydrolase
LLNHLQVAELPFIAISHLDVDHSGGAPEILTEFRGRIGKVCYPNDDRIRQTAFWACLQNELADGHLTVNQLVRLECEASPKLVWRAAALKAELKIFSPTFGENELAMEAEDANAVSGVLVLKVGDHRIVFPGDSSLEQWKAIRANRGAVIACGIISVPHHAGII